MLALQVYFSWLSYEVLDLCRVLLPPVFPVESEGLVSSSAMSTILRQNPFLRTLRTDLMPCAPRIDTADTSFSISLTAPEVDNKDSCFRFLSDVKGASW